MQHEPTDMDSIAVSAKELKLPVFREELSFLFWRHWTLSVKDAMQFCMAIPEPERLTLPLV